MRVFYYLADIWNKPYYIHRCICMSGAWLFQMHKLLLVVGFIGFALFCKAQPRYKSQEFGVNFGAAYYLGDLNPMGHFRFSMPFVGNVIRINFNRRYAFKSNIILGLIRADDSKSKNAWRNNRNLSFQSIIGEFSAQIEYNFMPYEPGHEKYTYSPFIFAGLSAFYFDPVAVNDGGERVHLQLLKTEAQAKRYWTLQPSIPFGIGYKWNIREKATFALEWGVRKTFTDYIDDVSTIYADPVKLTQNNGSNSGELSNRSPDSKLAEYIFQPFQRGDSKHTDWYSFAGIVFTVIISKEKSCIAY